MPLAMLLCRLAMASLSVATVTQAPDDSYAYNVMRSHSSVQFTVLKWKTFRESGRFTRFDGVLEYHPGLPTAASVEFTVAADSIQTDMALRDSILKSDDFLDAGRYSTLQFRSTSVTAIDDESLSVTGELTIRGITRRVTVPVTVIGVGTHPHGGRIAGFETRFVIDRTDFGIDGARWSGGRDSLSREVEVHVRIGSAEPAR